MKKHINPLFACVIMGVFTLAGCDSPLADKQQGIDSVGAVVVSIGTPTDANGTRTIYPTFDGLTRYELTFPDGPVAHEPEAITKDGGTVTLPVGAWTITATAYSGEGNAQTASARGSAAVTIEKGKSVQASIILGPIPTGTAGTLRYSITAPENVAGKLTLRPTAGGGDIEITLPVESNKDIRSLPAGEYLLFVSLTRNDKRAGKTEVLHIYSGMESEVEFSFTADDFIVAETVSYDTGAGSGTPPASQNVASGETIYLPGQGSMTAPSGQTFKGWQTNGQNYSAGDSFTVTGNTIFVAQWVAIKPSETYLTFGYDVINSGFINGGEVKKTMPVLSLSKLNAANMIVQRDTTASKFSTIAGESIKEFYDDVGSSISAGVDFKIFSGKVSVEFQKSDFTNTTHRYAKGIARHVIREEYLSSVAPSQLRNYLDDDFITAINNESADYILDHYGTHLIARCYWGGSAEFNYSYYGTTLNSASKVAAAVEEKYKAVSAGGSVSASTTVKELDNNSSFKYHTIGGNTTSFTNLDSFLTGYSTWVASIDKSTNELCGIDNFQQSFVPIWDLVEDSAKANAIKDKFTERALKQGSILDKDWLNVKSTTVTYNTAGTQTFPPYTHKQNSAGEYFPARFDVYLGGGGGGGQGAMNDYIWVVIKVNRGGTGGGGGGGAASYLSFTATERVTTIDLTVGTGGTGGLVDDNVNDNDYRNTQGKDGGDSSATWNGIKITAKGGKGGGTPNTVTGGAGGMASDSIPGYDSKSVAGSPGTTGNKPDNGGTGNNESKGGTAGVIGDFGGQVGGNNTGVKNGSYGGGGAGQAYDKGGNTGGDGGKGGDGLIKIVYYYYE
jgi:hypothetical protein